MVKITHLITCVDVEKTFLFSWGGQSSKSCIIVERVEYLCWHNLKVVLRMASMTSL